MKNVYLVITGVIVIVVAIFVFIANKSSNQQQQTPKGIVNQQEKPAVAIKNFSFSPQTLVVKVGTTVTWTNEDQTNHTVTSLDGKFESGDLATGQTFQFTFDTPGTYNYKCSIHSSMMGKIIVQ